MNLKTTLALAVLVASGAVLYFFGADAARRLGLAPAPPPAAASQTLTVLRDEFKPDSLNRIEIKHGDRQLVLDRAGARWTLPGGWETRKPEVERLVDLLSSGLQSRFAPESVAAADLEKYGLDRPAVTALVKAGGKDHTLAFSEMPGDTENRFSRPTYLRLNDNLEVVRLRPGLIAALTRPLAYYQQRRLFPSERVAKEDDPQEKVEQLAARTVEVRDRKDKAKSFTLTRIDGEWRITEPQPDRPSPDRLKALLAALPDVWAEQFIEGENKDLKEYGLDDPAALSVSVTGTDGRPVTLLVGKERRRAKAADADPDPHAPLMPKQPPSGDTVYHYAKLQGNDQLFEIRFNQLSKDVLVAAADLRDPRVARFRASDVTRLVVENREPKARLVLTQKDNRWHVEEPFQAAADSARVSDLLRDLGDLEAKDKADISYESNPEVDGLNEPRATVTVTLKEKDKEKQLAFELGKQTADKLYVRLKDGGRISAVAPGVMEQVSRKPLAYRGTRVLDVPSASVTRIDVRRDKEDFTLQKDKDDWRLAVGEVKAEADQGLAGRVAGDLSFLDAVEYVADKAAPEELEAQYGLAKPRLSAKVTYTKDDKPAEKEVLFGKKREGKEEYFAKLADTDEVFAVRKDVVEDLDKDSLAFRPLQFPRLADDAIDRVRVQKGKEPEYELVRKGAGWQIAGPFTAVATGDRAAAVARELGGLRGERYVTHAATPEELKNYGLDQPYLRLTLTPAKKDGEAKKDDPDPKKEGDAKKGVKGRTLLIGNPTDKDAKTRYAKLDDDPAVFVVGEKLVAAVDRGALDLLDPRLVNRDPDEVGRVERREGGKQLVLERKDKDWHAAEPPFVADLSAVNQLLVAVTGLTAERYAAFDPTKEELKDKYGLEPPAWTLTVTVRGPAPKEREKEQEKEKEATAEKYTLSVGKPVEGDKGGRYARFDDGKGGQLTKAVFILGPLAVKDLTFGHVDFVDRRVVDLKPDDKITKLTLKTEGPNGREIELVRQDNAWQMERPEKVKADEQVMDLLTLQLAELTARRVAAYPEKNSQGFGLKSPTATVRFEAGDKKVELKLGDAADKEGGDHYAQAADSDKVVVLPGDLVRRLTGGPLKFRNHLPPSVKETVTRALLERGDQKVVFVRADDTWRRLVGNEEFEIDSDDLEEFVNSLKEETDPRRRFRADELVADRPADLAPYGLDKPQARWRFLAGDKEVLTLLLGKKEGERCYAKLEPGDLVFLLDPKAATRLLTQQFRNRRLWPALDPEQIEKVVYRDFTLQRQGDRWEIAGQPTQHVDPERARETLAALANLKAERFEADRGADLKRYGLEEPQKVEVVLRRGKRALFVGAAAGPGKGAYVRVGGDAPTSDVHVLSAEDVGRIVRTPQAFAAPPRPPGGQPPFDFK